MRDHGGRCAHTDVLSGRGAPLPSAVLAGVMGAEDGPEAAGRYLEQLRKTCVRIPALFEAACISLLTQHALTCQEKTGAA